MLTRFFAALFVFSLFVIAPVRAETIVVTTDSGENPEDGLTSLREALQQANASPDETVLITFNIPDPNPETPAMDPIVIFLGSPLFVQRPMTIDGTTQPGYVPGTPIIQISQALPGAEPVEAEPAGPQAISVKSFSNFVIEYMVEPPTVAARALARADGDGTVFRGLSITHSQDNGLFFVNGSGHVVESCFIGIEPDGDAAGNSNAGIFVGIDVEGIRIGTNLDGNNDVLERNVISSNGETGIQIDGQDDQLEAAPLNVAAVPLGSILIAGNYIGTGPDGISTRGNGGDAEGEGSGILSLGTSVSIINNLVASHDIGIWIDQGDAVIQGNVVGLNSDGTAGNGNDIGIYVEPGTAVLIGTDSDGANDAAERNVISGNETQILAGQLDEVFQPAAAGLPAAFGEPDELTIAGNYIGLTLDGTAAALPADPEDVDTLDTEAGISVVGWEGTVFVLNNSIGGAFRGIDAYEVDQLVVQGNNIGLNAAGTAAAFNGDGLYLENVRAVLIGTDGDGQNDVAERNNISGNLFAGIYIEDYEEFDQINTSALAALELPSGKRISGNYIGTNAAGTAAISNGAGFAQLGDDITVGGIVILTPDNVVIGTDGDGSAGDAVEGNLVSGNIPFGILNYSTPDNGPPPFEMEPGFHIIAGNIIGLNAAGSASLPNGLELNEDTPNPFFFFPPSGIFSEGTRTRIGTNNDGISDTLEANTISGNTGVGVTVYSEERRRTVLARALPPVLDYNATIAGNRIGTGLDGVAASGNSDSGIFIYETRKILIGGTTAADGNVIANNGKNGIEIDGSVNNVTILSNSITNNFKLGIDLVAEDDGADGVTPNDEPFIEGDFVLHDPDEGANRLTNFPVLTTVSLDRKSVTGTLTGMAFSGESPMTYIVQIFGNPATSPEEGQKLLGSIEVILDSETIQPAEFTVDLEIPAAPGSFLTATATRADVDAPDTSEFSAPLAVPTLAFASGPGFTPANPTTDDVVTFTAQPNMPGITVIWDFGDGTPTATGESVTHTFGTPGVYQVTVTLLDEPTGTSITQVITVTVIAGATPPKANVPSFRVRDLNIRLGGGEGKDSITIMGLLNLPKNIAFAGKTIEFDIGGVKESFELNAKGKSKPGAKNFKFGKVNKLRNQETSFNLSLKKATYEAILKSSAVKKDANGLPTELVVRITFNGQETVSTVPLRFRLLKSGATAKFGRF